MFEHVPSPVFMELLEKTNHANLRNESQKREQIERDNK